MTWALLDRPVGAEVRLAKRRILMGPAACLVAIALSFVGAGVSLAIYALIPLLYLIPGRLDRHWVSPRSKLAEPTRRGDQA